MFTRTRWQASTCTIRHPRRCAMGRIVGLVFDSAPVDPAELTKAELKEQLDCAGVEYDDKMTKDELVALLKE